MTETEIQRQIIDYLKASGYLVWRLNSGKAAHNIQLCPPGTPDLFAVGKGCTIWVEVKTPTGKVSERQAQMHDYLTANGQRVIVARCVEDIINHVQRESSE